MSRHLVEHPTFMYGNGPDKLVEVILTWWVDGEQFALQTVTMIENERNAHQYLLNEFVHQIQIETPQSGES